MSAPMCLAAGLAGFADLISKSCKQHYTAYQHISVDFSSDEHQSNIYSPLSHFFGGEGKEGREMSTLYLMFFSKHFVWWVSIAFSLKTAACHCKNYTMTVKQKLWPVKPKQKTK